MRQLGMWRFVAPASIRRPGQLFSALAAGLALLALVSRPAWASDYGQFDDPTDIDYAEWRWVTCLSPTDIDNGFVDPSCLSDATEENHARNEVKSQDRWLKAGLLMAAQVWSGVEYLRDVIQRGKDAFAAVTQLTNGHDRPRPRQFAVRITDASDAIADRLRMGEHLAISMPTTMGEPRYTDIHTLAMRALGIAREAQLAGVTLSDQASGMQGRLGSGPVTFLGVGDDALSDGLANPPPLPEDADSTMLTFYSSTVPSLPSTVSTWRLTVPSSAAASASIAATSARFAGTGRRIAPLLAGPPPAATTCPIDDEDAADPQALYERASVMAKGAQTGTTAVMADVQQIRDEMRTVREREEQAEVESFWLDLLRLINLL